MVTIKSELENKLAEEFSFMRRDPSAIKQEFVSGLYGAFGCECGDGWYELLRSMCTEISDIYDSLGMEPSFTPVQIKEKYGALRVYYDTHRETGDKIREIIGRYEEISETVCEECGQHGVLRNDLAWIRTLCNAHYREMKIQGANKMRKVQVGITVTRFENQAPDGNRQEIKIYADSNNTYEALCAAFYETLDAIQADVKYLPHDGRRMSSDALTDRDGWDGCDYHYREDREERK